MQSIIKDLDSYKEFSEQLIANSSKSNILLYGEMGAGKTTLTQYLLDALGSKEEVSSPTYSIINEYKGPNKNIFHMDLYRLNSKEEAVNIGIEEYLHSDNLCIIEWPQLILDLLDPNEYDTIKIEILDKSTRRIILN